MPQNPTRQVHHIKIAKERSFFPKETAQRLAVDKLYSGKAGLEAVQRIGDTYPKAVPRCTLRQAQGPPWSPVKLIYPLAARGERPR